MLYRLSDTNRWHFEQRAQWSALSEEPREGYFRLYNKNAGTTLHVKKVGQEPHEMVWLVEFDDVVPEYFKNVLVEA
jgi:hypothetical protein